MLGSLLVHAAAGWYALTNLSPPKLETSSDVTGSPLIARLAPVAPVAPVALPAPAPTAALARPVRPPTPRKTSPATAAPSLNVLTAPPLETPAVVVVPPEPVPPVTPPIAAPAPSPRIPPQVTDLSAYIALQRATSRAIGDPDADTGRDDRRASAAEIENQRRNRVIAGNLAGTSHQGMGFD